MKGMKHRSVAENEGQGSCLISIDKVDIEICGRIHHGLLNGRIHTIISIQDAGNSRDADLRGCGDFSQSWLGCRGNCFFHILNLISKDPLPLPSTQLCTIVRVFSMNSEELLILKRFSQARFRMALNDDQPLARPYWRQHLPGMSIAKAERPL
jgi:hypothetical protein